MTTNVDFGINTHPSGATGTDLTGHSSAQMLGPPGVIATNIDTNIEAHTFGFSPVQATSQRGIKQNILDQAFYNSVEVSTIQVDAGSARGTVLFRIPWGSFQRGTLKYLAAAHNDCCGDIIHEVRVIGNTLFTGALIVAWMPNNPTTVSVSDVMRYDYQILAANMQKNYTFVNHTSKIEQFFSTLDIDGNVTSNQQVGTLIGMVHTPIQATSATSDSFIVLHITERFANPNDISIGAKPFHLNWARSDTELESILSPPTNPTNNLYQMAANVFASPPWFVVDSTVTFPNLHTPIDYVLADTYINPLRNGLYVTQSKIYDTDGQHMPVIANYSATSGVDSSFLLYSVMKGMPAISENISNTIWVDNFQYLGMISGEWLPDETERPGFESVAQLQTYFIEHQNCLYSFSFVPGGNATLSYCLPGQGFLDYKRDAAANTLSIDTVAIGQWIRGYYQIDCPALIISVTAGIRRDGTAVYCILVDYNTINFGAFKTVDKNGDVLVNEKLDDATVIKVYRNDEEQVLLGTYNSAKDMRGPFSISHAKWHATSPVISSTIADGYYMDPNANKPVRISPSPYRVHAVTSEMDGTRGMMCYTNPDEKIFLQQMLQRYPQRTLISVGNGNQVTMQFVFEPSVPTLLANCQQYSLLGLNEANMYIMASETVSSSTIPASFPVWQSRVAPSAMPQPEFNRIAAMYAKLQTKRPITSGPPDIDSHMMAAVVGGAIQGTGSGISQAGNMFYHSKEAAKNREFLADQARQQRTFLTEQLASVLNFKGDQARLSREQQLEMLITGQTLKTSLSGGMADAYRGTSSFHPVSSEPLPSTEIVRDEVIPETATTGVQADLGIEAGTQTITPYRPYNIGTIISPSSNLKALDKSFVKGDIINSTRDVMSSLSDVTTQAEAGFKPSTAFATLPDDVGKVPPTMTMAPRATEQVPSTSVDDVPVFTETTPEVWL